MADYRDALKAALQKLNEYYCEFGKICNTLTAFSMLLP